STQPTFHQPAQTKRIPSPRCASAIQIVRPRESTADTQPQLQLAFLRLPAIFPSTSRGTDSACFARSALLIVHNHLRSSAAHLDLRAHVLQSRSKRFNLLLLLRNLGLKVFL